MTCIKEGDQTNDNNHKQILSTRNNDKVNENNDKENKHNEKEIHTTNLSMWYYKSQFLCGKKIE